jgi:signal transduction histidine kinase
MPQITIELSEEALLRLRRGGWAQAIPVEEYAAGLLESGLQEWQASALAELAVGLSQLQEEARQQRVALEREPGNYRNLLLGKIDQALDEAKRLTDNMFRIGPRGGAMLTLYRSSFAIREWIDLAASRARSSPYHTDKHHILTEVRANVPIFLLGDKDKLEQVLSNLLGNALKFSPEGGTVALTVDTTPQQELLVVLQDQGMGIPPDFLPRYATKLARIADRPQAGTGIGAFLARAFIELHDGHLMVRSPGFNRGTTVSFTLPLLPGAVGKASNLTERLVPISRRLTELTHAATGEVLGMEGQVPSRPITLELESLIAELQDLLGQLTRGT